MIYLVLISILVITAYTIAVCVKQKGIPYSISATFYKLEHPYWFMGTMWLTSGLLMPAILETSNPNTDFLAALAIFGMMMVGAAPNFKEKYEGRIHIAGAIMCIFGSQLWVMFNQPWSLVVWIPYILYTIIRMLQIKSDSIITRFIGTKPMFWIEIVALISTYISILMFF